ncbi:MAG: AAA family ATPase [Anaerolineae bacterium]|jgi:predicted ATPase|nr:AAA family ATPase [Anaerolineae bacterium]
MLLESIQFNSLPKSHPRTFPYTIPFIQNTKKVHFNTPITFLVGENGSGKSSFLEMIACAIGSITVGTESVTTDKFLAPIRQFAEAYLKLVWSKRTKKGFFMRAEDFFGYAKRMAQTQAEMQSDLQAVDEEYAEKSAFTRALAEMPYKRELYEMQKDYGDGLDANSHGEGFFKLFQRRFVGEGVYLLDEPEAPLSPNRQLAFLVMLKDMIGRGGQFIIATHSPILLAYPNATILNFDEGHIRPIVYDDLEHVTVTRNFLNNPQAYLRHLFDDAD